MGKEIIFQGDTVTPEDIDIPQRGLLSHDDILSHIQRGNITIYPLQEGNIGGASVDVSLGEYYWRENTQGPSNGLGDIINLWDDEASRQLWSGPFEAKPLKDFLTDAGVSSDTLVRNLSLDDQVIILRPNENILGHTTEFIGGNQIICTAMQARSSLGRSGITVCRCAGWGDPGYTNRWTMEITNNSKHHSVILVVGRRIAQIVFWEVTPVESSYSEDGKYQKHDELSKLVSRWSPDNMLPQLFLDKDIQRTAWNLGQELERRDRRLSGRGPKYAIQPARETADLRLSEKNWGYYNIFKEMGLRPDELEHLKIMLEEDNVDIFEPESVV